jgi:hypothetical protein
MTISNPIPGRYGKPHRQARSSSAVSRAAHLVMAFGYCPIWISSLLLSYQALAELGNATKRQATK